MDRLRSKWLNALLVHTPIHASWLNQIEIYFSIFQREVLNPNEKTASPFQWTFKRSDLHALLVKIGRKRLVAAA